MATKLKRRIQATQKQWVPNKFSRVCFEQFVDGFSSTDHPDPELKLGYKTKVAKKRQAPVVRNFNPKLIKTSNDFHAKKSSDDASCFLVSTVDNSITSNDVPPTTKMERSDILHYQAMKKNSVYSTSAKQRRRRFGMHYLTTDNKVKFYTGSRSRKIMS